MFKCSSVLQDEQHITEIHDGKADSPHYVTVVHVYEGMSLEDVRDVVQGQVLQ